jgi:hypothetical protein
VSGWENFSVGQVGASAALAGLVFVGVSINLGRILSFPQLPNRALEAIILLVAVLLESSITLVPAKSTGITGAAVFLVGLLVWVAATALHWAIFQKSEKQYRRVHVPLAVLG